MEAKKLCPPESFSDVISSYCELEDGPIIKQKAKILWILKNCKITGISTNNHWSVTGVQNILQYKNF